MGQVNLGIGFAGEYDLFIAGDICLTKATPVIGKGIQNIMAQAKYRIVNLECPLTKSGQTIQKTGPLLKGNPTSVNLLRDMGVDLCNLANNHIMDYGVAGLEETMDALQMRSIDTIGVTKTLDSVPFVKMINSVRVAFVSFTENEFSTLPLDQWQAYPMDHYVQLRQIRAAKEHSDFVLVQYHGGAELYPYPSPGQKKYAHYLVELGADMVICHHSHRFSGFEVFQDKPIFYGLGNFCFPLSGNPSPWYRGLGLQISFAENLEVTVLPLKLHLDTLRLDLAGEEYDPICREIDEINKVILADDLLGEKWSDFCSKNEYASLSAVFRPSRLLGLMIRKRLLRNHLRNKTDRVLLNYLRCETHREKLVTTIKQLLGYE